MVTYEQRDESNSEHFGVRVNGQLWGTLEYHDVDSPDLGKDEPGWFFYPFHGEFRTRLCGDEWRQATQVVRLCTEAYLRGKGLL